MTDRSAIDDQIERLEHFFQRRDVSLAADDGDNNEGGDYWELKDPSAMISWTVLHVPHTPDIAFAYTFRGKHTPLSTSFDEKVKEVVHENIDVVHVHCETTVGEPYQFTLCVNNTVSPFNVTDFLQNLPGSKYEPLVKEIESQRDNRQWVTKDGSPLKAKGIASKIRQIIVTMAAMTAEKKRGSALMLPLEVSRRTESQDLSQTSMGYRTPRATPTSSNLRLTAPSQTERPPGSQGPESSNRKKSKPASVDLPEASIQSALTEVPAEFGPGKVAVHNEVQEIYEKFWTKCQDCFVFAMDTKLERGMHQTKHFLINMPDKTVKQSLRVMPMTDSKPSSWEEFRNCNFYIINGQHSVAASKQMIEEQIPEPILKHFRTWNCLIVWTKDKQKLRRLSAYYNRVNHFSVFKPTWSTNVLAALYIWTQLGKPIPPKSATRVGKLVTNPVKDAANDKREFFKWLGNMSESDHYKMILHMLNRSGPKGRYKYPKVITNQPKTVLDSCYSAKEWMERRKRKQLVRKKLQKINPTLGLFNAAGEFQPARWKKFKHDYNLTNATMRVLLEAPVEDFFSAAKLTRNKSKSCEELPCMQKSSSACSCDAELSSRSQLGKHTSNCWLDDGNKIKLGTIDFRRVPGFSSKEKSTVSKPYFEDFMSMFVTCKLPQTTDPPVWLFICGDEDAELQIPHFAQAHKLAKENVRLLWLVKNSEKDIRPPPKLFQAPGTLVYTKPRKYQELEYRLYTSELRIEFYIRILDMFCKPGDTVYSVFTGTKIVPAGVMSCLSMFCVSHFKDSEPLAEVSRAALLLDKYDCVSDGYHVDQERHPRTPRKTGKKKEVEADDDDFIDDREEELHDENETEAREDDELSVDHDFDDRQSVSLEGEILTPTSDDLDDLPQGHTLPTPKSLFQEEEDPDLILLQRPSSAPTLGERLSRSRSKRPRESSRLASSAGGSPPLGRNNDDLRETLRSMVEGIQKQQLAMAASMAKQTPLNHEMVLRQRLEMQEEMRNSQKTIMDFTTNSMKSLLMELPGIVNTMMQKVMPAIDAASLSSKEPQLMLSQGSGSNGSPVNQQQRTSSSNTAAPSPPPEQAVSIKSDMGPPLAQTESMPPRVSTLTDSRPAESSPHDSKNSSPLAGISESSSG
uniref:Uncharacterized protein n=1 Tax=Physcomitrium patens TaxID=3218 RepID=A0A7I4AG42_PHYPA